MKKTFMLLTALLMVWGASASIYKSGVTASYYADKFHGRTTANGEIFNMYGYTCAHKTLPFNTMLRVTNLANGKSVIVRVNDRGPFVAGREIDLSKAAAVKIGMTGTGTAKVKIETVSLVEKKPASSAASSEEELVTAESLPKIQLENANIRLLPGTEWDIQVGAFKEKRYAEDCARRLLDAGFINVVYQKTEGITRVVVRKVAAEDVESTQQKLANEGFNEQLIRKRS